VPVLVAGHANLDRVWQLAEPLRAGARLNVLSRHLRLGGGGANTAAALVTLGAPVKLACRLASDTVGDAMFAWLAEAGVDMAATERHDGATTAGDILLDPSGERTLLGTSSAAASHILPTALLNWSGRVAYVNLSRLADPSALAAVTARCLLVAQMPLDLAQPRPVQVLIASRSDVSGISPEELFRRRAVLDTALRQVVLTDGPGSVALADASGVRMLEPAGPAVSGNTIGAGDFFAAGLLQALGSGAEIGAAVGAGQLAARRLLVTRPAALEAWRDVEVLRN
jgi:sugar/nucleoside kinase (ribokinase family)